MTKTTAQGCGWMLATVFGLVLLGQCVSDMPPQSDLRTQQDNAATLMSGAPEATTLAPPSGKSLLFEEGQTVYVTANSLNARSEPSLDGSVISTLPYGRSAQVTARSGNWAKVRLSSGEGWISSDYVTRTRPAPRRQYRPSTRRSRYYGGTCPCSGSRVCIGPRGGRYCITSGGNKRYGV